MTMYACPLAWVMVRRNTMTEADHKSGTQTHCMQENHLYKELETRKSIIRRILRIIKCVCVYIYIYTRVRARAHTHTHTRAFCKVRELP
jgi:hypothetical protein